MYSRLILITSFCCLLFLSACSTNVEQKITMEEIDGEYFYPAEPEKNIVIIFIGGSGLIPDEFDYDMFTDAGYICLALAYCGTQNTVPTLDNVPMEYFDKAISSIKMKPKFDDKKIVFLGDSKGAELSLLVASRNSDVDGVIARVPSSVIWQGDNGDNARWSLNSESLPYVPWIEYIEERHTSYLKYFQDCLEQKAEVSSATIPVEKIKGPILFLSGTEDSIWPSTWMADEMVKRLNSNNFEYYFEHVAYEGAGHGLSEYMMYGGTEEDNKKARMESDIKIFEFLERIANE